MDKRNYGTKFNRMKKSKKDKQLENLLFEVYEKGVNNEDCDLTAYIEKVKVEAFIMFYNGLHMNSYK